MSKKLAITLLVVVLLIFLISIVVYVNKSPNLKFSTRKCGASVDLYSKPKAGILSEAWKDDSTLIVEGYVITFLDGAKIYGDYAKTGKNLILKYEVKEESQVALSSCAHTVIYEISNLAKQDYSISLIPK